MNYTEIDFLRAVSRYRDVDVECITYMSFMAQYDIYSLGPIKIAVKYMYAGRPITRNRFHIGFKFIVMMDIPGTAELFGKYRLPPPVEDRIFKIWHKYHNWPIQKLRHTIRKKLQLKPEEKRGDYLGVDVDKYLKAEGFKLIKKEI